MTRINHISPVSSVLIIDDLDIVRAGISAIINRTHEINCVAEIADVKKAISTIKKIHPDLALIDLNMQSHHDGFDLIYHIQQKEPNTKILVITADTNLYHLSRALKLGANGIILKNDRKMITSAIKSVIKGKRFIQPDIAYELMSVYLNQPECQKLNKTQLEILVRKSSGKKPQEISRELRLNTKYISNEITKIKKILNIKTPAELNRIGEQYSL